MRTLAADGSVEHERYLMGWGNLANPQSAAMAWDGTGAGFLSLSEAPGNSRSGWTILFSADEGADEPPATLCCMDGTMEFRPEAVGILANLAGNGWVDVESVSLANVDGSYHWDFDADLQDWVADGSGLANWRNGRAFVRGGSFGEDRLVERMRVEPRFAPPFNLRAVLVGPLGEHCIAAADDSTSLRACIQSSESTATLQRVVDGAVTDSVRVAVASLNTLSTNGERFFLELSVDGNGQASASVQRASARAILAIENEFPVAWTTIDVFEGIVAVTQGNVPLRFNREAEYDPSSFTLDSEATDMKTWFSEDDGTWRTGVVVAETNEIILGEPGVSSRGYRRWPFTSMPPPVLGRGAGPDPGEFLFPLSFDVGPDGRFYVLDAGNARIQVFNRNGTYLTQWGRAGSEDGQFDFGRGGSPEDFAGSIAVDDEGFIYVADVGNRRIQKFAP